MWDKLSIKDKAEIIKMSVANGIRDLNTIRDTYNNIYAEGGHIGISDQQYYDIMERVAKENNPIWNKQRIKEGVQPLSEDEEYLRILNDNSYDYRGYYNKYPDSRANADTHWTDEFKTVYHPTFSKYSSYSEKRDPNYNPQSLKGGNWLFGTLLFIPQPWQLLKRAEERSMLNNYNTQNK